MNTLLSWPVLAQAASALPRAKPGDPAWECWYRDSTGFLADSTPLLAALVADQQLSHHVKPLPHLVGVFGSRVLNSYWD